MNMIDLLSMLAHAATAIGVGIAAWQLRTTRQQNRAAFEGQLFEKYREVADSLPSEALFGESLSDEVLAQHLHTFYRYFDLTNEEILFRRSKRISRATWLDWAEGIADQMRLPAFQQAWKQCEMKPAQRFRALQWLMEQKFRKDPVEYTMSPPPQDPSRSLNSGTSAGELTGHSLDRAANRHTDA